MQFKIGDEVVTKKVGLPAIGRVVGIVSPEVITDPMTRWDKVYPDWKSGTVAYIKFKRPQRPLSLEEWKESIPPEIRDHALEEDLEIMYINSVHVTKFSMIPMCDLEKFA